MRSQIRKLLSTVLILCITLTLCPMQINAKDKGDGSRENPYSAYESHVIKLRYNDGSYAGKFRIKLLDYKDGSEAKEYIKKTDEYDSIKKSRECVYMKFKIKYVSGKDEIGLVNLLYMDGDIYNKKANRHLWIDNLYGYKSELDWLSASSLYPGGSIKCYEAFTVPKGDTPITYRIQTGVKNGELTYTWFTTKK